MKAIKRTKSSPEKVKMTNLQMRSLKGNRLMSKCKVMAVIIKHLRATVMKQRSLLLSQLLKFPAPRPSEMSSRASTTANRPMKM